MKFYDTLKEESASFVAKEHSRAFGNCGECKMNFHIHPGAEILMVTRGELTVQVLGREPERVGAGACAFIFPFQTHSYYRPEGTEYFRFNFSPSLIQAFFIPNKDSVGEKSVFSINEAQYLQFISTVRRGRVSLCQVKGFLYNMVSDYSSCVRLLKKHGDETLMGKVIDYINEHKSDRVTLKDMAKTLGYNEKYLSRSINRLSGLSFSTMLSTFRVEEARRLLKNTRRTVVDIAMECGFGSERNFYRVFKEITGHSPNEYRFSPSRSIFLNDVVL